MPAAPGLRWLESAMSDWFRNEPLSRHCSWKIGGPAEWFVAPASEAELLAALRKAAEQQLPVTVIGSGSNILFADSGVRGLVVHIGHRFGQVRIAGTRLTAEAGVYMPCLARQSMQAGLSGLEHTIGIPGTVGGLVVMNGGSLRSCVSECLTSVRAVHRVSMKPVELAVADCGFAYRTSIFQKGEWVITQLQFALIAGDRRKIHSDMRKILCDRRSKFPLKMPSCGSVFKSDPDVYQRFGAPGKLIESLGFKGRRCGGAMVSERHANFIVNCGNATAADVLTLTEDIKAAVRDHFGVEMHEEYRKVGDFA